MDVETYQQEALWCVEANIVRERPFGSGGHTIKHGTIHFRGGAKVYVIDWFAGVCQNVVVIGHHRKSSRFVKMILPATSMDNLRMKLVYSPTIIAMIKEHYQWRGAEPFLTKDEVEAMVKALPYWQTR